MTRQPVDQSAVIRLFEEIRAAFPRLSMQLETEPQHVDLDMTIRRQPGLAFDVNLNLQGDELHLGAGAFHLEWFPCTRPNVVEAYREAVHGLLSGEYRIREHQRGTRVFKAELQRPHADGWQTIATSATLRWPFAGRTVEKILQNVAD